MTREEREIENRIERLQDELCYEAHDESGKLELRGKINDAREALAQARRGVNKRNRRAQARYSTMRSLGMTRTRSGNWE